MLFIGLLCILFIILQCIVRSKRIYPKEQYKSHLSAMLDKEGVVVSEILANIPGQVRIKNNGRKRYQNGCCSIRSDSAPWIS